LAMAQQTSDTDRRAWVTSLVLHLCFILVLARWTWSMPRTEQDIILSMASETVEPDLRVEQFIVSEEDLPEIGVDRSGGLLSAQPLALEQADVAEVPEPEALETPLILPVPLAVETPRGPIDGLDTVVRGSGSTGVTGTSGAIDRITHEILMSLEQRPTLVVWLFDRSGSLARQREAVLQRFDRIYEELGVVQASRNPAFAKHEDIPLLTSVAAFGHDLVVMTPRPTDQLSEIQAAVSAIQPDPSGRENIFTAIHDVAQQYLGYRVRRPRHNVMLVVFTDEAGDDPTRLEDAVAICRKYQMPVYVVGVPAPFGRKQSFVKYVDPNPEFDQTPQWAPVDQGPESLFPERIKLGSTGMGGDRELFDSGFGPYGLTRLCLESGGLFFSVHPNRRTDRAVHGREIAELAAHFVRFFDSEVMRKYRPVYRSIEQFERWLRQNKARVALVEAARFSWITPMESVQATFPKKDEGTFVRLLSLAQRDAAKLEPNINMIYETLRRGEPDRVKLMTPRWQAGYDLAMGRTLAVKVRTEAYNAMLAKAKNGMAFQDEKNDTWRLKPSDSVASDSTLAAGAQEARDYLSRVVTQHPQTPWAVLAERELQQPFSWQWTELYTGVNATPETAAGGRAALPRDDVLRPLTKPKPRRKPPAL